MKPEHKLLLSPVETPRGLADDVFACICKRARKGAQFRFGALFAISLTSLSFGISLSMNLWHGIIQSGFYDYLSLAITDMGALGSFWKELLVSLAESLPALTLAGFLAVAGVFVWSSAKAVKNVSILKTI